jgi:hypothetical protein
LNVASALPKLLVSLAASVVVLAAPASSLGARPKSYWLVSSTGQVFAYGKAKVYGTEAGKKFRGTITGIKGTPNGGGYWIVTSRAHYGFGDASRYGYEAGGLKKYTGKIHPKGLRGKIVGYAVATIRAKPSGGQGGSTGGGSTTGSSVDCSRLTILTASLSPAIATEEYSQALSAGGVSGGSWSWTVTSGGLPGGLSLSGAGVLSGIPAQGTAGVQSDFAVQATNSECPSHPVTKSYVLPVGVPPMTITTTSLPSGTYGQAYSPTTLGVTGGQPGDYEWSASGWQWSNTGLSLSTSGVLSGTPQTTGTYNVTFTVADSTGATPPVSVTIPITIAYPPLQITSPASLNDGQAAVAYGSVTFTASGGSEVAAPPQYQAGLYEWSASGLPPGLSMSIHGVLSGTPTQAGNYEAQITVTDSQEAVPPVTVGYPLTIADAPLEFTTTTLTAIQGQSYTGHVVAQGGEAPYTMYRLSGSLPAGMTFNNGTITVAPTVAAGHYQFDIGVTDSENNPATMQETFSMWVAPSEGAPELTVGSSVSGPIWAGYVARASAAFTSVSGTFTVPTLYSTPSNSVTPWVGIDGYGTSNLIQAGVEASVDPPGSPAYEAWWETVGPAGSQQDLPPQNEFEVSPGDLVNVNIWQLSGGEWEITLNDTTSGRGFAAQVSYSGADDTAEWIVETPSGAMATGYGATTVFSNLAASQTGSGMLELSTTGATPSALTANGFSIDDYN